MYARIDNISIYIYTPRYESTHVGVYPYNICMCVYICGPAL